MAKKKSKKGKASRANYRSWRGERNKKSHKEREARRQGFYQVRNEVMKNLGIGKSEARRKVRELQESGQVDKSLSP